MGYVHASARAMFIVHVCYWLVYINCWFADTMKLSCVYLTFLLLKQILL